MRIRHLIEERKTLLSDTGWKTGQVAPRYAPIFNKTRPALPHWKWRSAKLQGEGSLREYVLFAQNNSLTDNWKAWLMLLANGGWSLVSRYEFHADHPGLHVHSDCTTSGILIGPQGIDGLTRFPKASSKHRRKRTWTEVSFWESAKQFYRVHDATGPLI